MADERDPNQTVDESVKATYAGSSTQPDADDDLEDRITDEVGDAPAAAGDGVVRQVAERLAELAPPGPRSTAPGWPQIEATHSRGDETPLGDTRPALAEPADADMQATLTAAPAGGEAPSRQTPGGATMLHVPSNELRIEPPPQLAGAIDSPEPAPRRHTRGARDDGEPDDEATTDERRKVPSVQLSPLEAAAAAELAEREAARFADEPVTQIVSKPRARPLRRECRFCGTRVAEPQPTRLMRPDDQGYLCDTCNNVYCGEHVVRTTGVLRSLLSGARYRCVLCVDPDSV